MKKIKSRKGLILYGCSGLGVNMLNMIVGSYLCSALLVGGFDKHIESWTYLNKDLVVAGLWAVLIFFAKALDGVIDLPMSAFADKLNTKFGRRKTAILMGLVPMIAAYLLFLVPINDGASYVNTIWFGGMLCLFYASYTLTMLTYYATFSEVCETERDTLFLSNTKSICDVVYMSLSFALVPVFVSLGVNIRIVAIIFLPLVLTMLIPFFLLKESKESGKEEQASPLTLEQSLACSFKNKMFIYWLCTSFVLTMGTQLFLGGINELFSSTGLNMTLVMASSFAPVPLTLIVYNWVVKRYGFANAFRYVLTVFAIGMIVMYICNVNSARMTTGQLTAVAICGGIFVSFALGAFFSISYTVPSYLAKREMDTRRMDVSSIYFATLGLFEGIAAGVATGLILVTLKANNVISLLPIIVALCAGVAFAMSFGFKKELAYMGKENKEALPVEESGTGS